MSDDGDKQTEQKQKKAPWTPRAELSQAPILTLGNVGKVYKQASGDLHVLRDVSIVIKPGEMVALVGPSGAGKSTLLHIAGLLDRPTSGTVALRDRDMTRASDRERTQARRRWIGFVYQHHYLLPEFSALENVVIPQMISGLGRKAARERAQELLKAMGLEHRQDHRPGKLSGGEQQRVAIARAVSNGPMILLADEPTGNLDHHTADSVFTQLKKLVNYAKIGALVATHNLELAGRMDRILHLQDGVISTGQKK